ncbi:MAG: 16S rRNA (guanine(527)-N(7))-methyltransferase RsmG [Endozoicomonas sp. (ex Botrylloides leachii)]|nr:16S rRNA (guanine(527)-N(7))-methyltransferase RsmG [Endozoicomonas sp. (ex Botrylloides leachii)]
MCSENCLYQCILDSAKKLSLELTNTQVDLLTRYIELLKKWNKAYNLTAIKDPKQMVYRHILDSLSIAPYIKSDNILDVGSGAGFPGIPLAILYPEKQVTTLDSNGKKTRFMVQVKIELCLQNLAVVHERVELYKPDQLFGEITSRAFSSLADMVQGTKHLLSQSGVYLAMKGLYPEKELWELTTQTKSELVRSIELTVPGSEGVRHLVIVRNK